MAQYFKIFMGLKIILCARGKGQIQDLRIGYTYVLCWRGSVGNSPSTSTAGYCGCVYPPPTKNVRNKPSPGGPYVPGLAAESGPLPPRLSGRVWRPLK